jgi:hypothetical protein
MPMNGQFTIVAQSVNGALSATITTIITTTTTR